jgi:hypothetical protein
MTGDPGSLTGNDSTHNLEFKTYNPRMAEAVSQRTMVEVIRAMRESELDYAEELYAIDFRDWFIKQAGNVVYSWNWTKILIDMRNGTFFNDKFRYTAGPNITGENLSDEGAKQLGESLIEKLAAFSATLGSGDSVRRSLELDGFAVDRENLRLVPIEGTASAREEEDRLTRLMKNSGIPQTRVVLKHIEDAQSLYAEVRITHR